MTKDEGLSSRNSGLTPFTKRSGEDRRKFKTHTAKLMWLASNKERRTWPQHYDRRMEDDLSARIEHFCVARSELTRWIPVTERLPEVPLGKEVPCWVCTEKLVFLSWYVNRPYSEEHDGAEWVVESDSGDPLDCVGWHKYGCNNGYDDFFMPEDDASKIVAWQPIPQPSRYERPDS